MCKKKKSLFLTSPQTFTSILQDAHDALRQVRASDDVHFHDEIHTCGTSSPDSTLRFWHASCSHKAPIAMFIHVPQNIRCRARLGCTLGGAASITLWPKWTPTFHGAINEMQRHSECKKLSKATFFFAKCLHLKLLGFCHG